MTWRQRILWALSGLMLIWIGVRTLSQYNASTCTQSGGQWSMLDWECRPARHFLLQRDLYRS